MKITIDVSLEAVPHLGSSDRKPEAPTEALFPELNNAPAAVRGILEDAAEYVRVRIAREPALEQAVVTAVVE